VRCVSAAVYFASIASKVSDINLSFRLSILAAEHLG
jgi:hypothetical protein